MTLIISWVVTAAIFFLFSALGFLIHIESFGAALILSLLFALFYVLIRWIASLLKISGCLTLGIGYVIGVIVQIIAYPLALIYASRNTDGVSEVTFWGAVLLSILVIFIRDAILSGTEKRKGQN